MTSHALVRTQHRNSRSPSFWHGLVDTLWHTAAQQGPLNLFPPSSAFRCRCTRQTARQQRGNSSATAAQGCRLDLGQAVVKVLGLLAREDGLVLLRHSRSGRGYSLHVSRRASAVGLGCSVCIAQCVVPVTLVPLLHTKPHLISGNPCLTPCRCRAQTAGTEGE